MTDRKQTPPNLLWAQANHNGSVGGCWHNATIERPEEMLMYNEYILNTEDAMREAGYVPVEKAVSVTNGIEWLETVGMIYNVVDADSGWENGKRPQINQYMIRFSRQLSADGSDEELAALQVRVLSALTTHYQQITTPEDE